MRRAVRTIRLIALLFLTAVSESGCRNRKPDPAQALAEKVAAVGCFSWNIEKDLADAGERLDSLSEDESETADRALVMLVGYYLGEHNSEELEKQIVRRGQRMKPLLLQEQQSAAVLSTCAPRNKPDLVKSLTDDAIRMIDHGASEKQAER
jgi:hypothetical protein